MHMRLAYFRGTPCSGMIRGLCGVLKQVDRSAFVFVVPTPSKGRVTGRMQTCLVLI